ncbi:MAG TPA: hypothetical protein PLD75_10575 [Spirochaetota bacterium]|nr:hypothetical protein [Spirochaetota bacterium]
MKNKFFILVCFLLISCSTLVKSYKNNEKNSIDLTKVEIRENKKGNKWIEIKSKIINPIVFIGNFNIDETGDIDIYINAMKFLATWPNGWTEGEASVYARLKLIKEDDYYRCKVEENFQFFEITKGAIRYQDDYYYDEKGLTNVKNKFDRIMALNEFLKNNNNMPEFFYTPIFKSKYGESYKERVERILFPEFFSDSIIYKDPEFKITDPSNDLVLAETILWNKKYTDKIFPEHLRNIRNSGTMLRDFEETIELCFAEYNLKYFFEKFLPEQKLIVIK